MLVTMGLTGRKDGQTIIFIYLDSVGLTLKVEDYHLKFGTNNGLTGKTHTHNYLFIFRYLT